MKNSGGKKIFMAMSGGVDSWVAAAMLKKQGYDITGVFVKGWYPEGMVCGWKEERRDAIRAAAKIGVPLLTFDFSKEYEKKVLEYMKKEYASARTPNPDVMCNKYIKFGLFLDKALKMGANKIATGHYVRLKNKKLSEAKDKNKDQSYFLWTLTQEQLKYCLFPIGDYTKPEVRRMAQRFGLHNAQKSDSQGLCFVGDIDFAIFLRKILPKKEGKIMTVDGKIVGRHDGVHFYTIGQRHGLNVAGRSPYYVVDKDLKKNILFVAEQRDEKKFYKREVAIADVNWISGKKPNLSKKPYGKFDKYLGRIRYRQPLQFCKIENYKLKIVNSKNYKVIFRLPQRAVTSGQSLVLYREAEMLGGGIII